MQLVAFGGAESGHKCHNKLYIDILVTVVSLWGHNSLTINKTAEGIDEFSHESRYDIILSRTRQ